MENTSTLTTNPNNELEKLKKTELAIFKFIDDICRKENITYMAAGGTLIGCIRHKGFIPWDDDIDLMLPRPDFEKFLEVMETTYGNERYKCLSDRTVKDYFYPFAKVVDTKTYLVEQGYPLIQELGVYVDLFPLDGLPGTQLMRNLYVTVFHFYITELFNSLAECPLDSTSPLFAFLKRITYRHARKKGWQYWLRKIENKRKHHAYQECKMAGCVVSGYGKRELLDKKVFSSQIDWHFESLIVRIPKEYDIYLRSLYGDYMQLPPIEKRTNKHEFTVEYLE